jgi:hypothetical protein
MNMGRARYVANAWASTEDDESACHDEVVVMDGSRRWLKRLSVVIVMLMI